MPGILAVKLATAASRRSAIQDCRAVGSSELEGIADLLLGDLSGCGGRAGGALLALVGRGLAAEGFVLGPELSGAEDVGVPEVGGVGPVDGGDGLVRCDPVHVDQQADVVAPRLGDPLLLAAALF